jgi:Tfp pilus assembly protein PilV
MIAKMPIDKKPNARGMTMLEIVLAALLLSLTAGGIGMAVSFTQTHMLRGLLLNEAVAFSGGRVEELTGLPYNDPALATGATTTVNLPDASLLKSQFTGAASYAVTEQTWGTTSPDLYKEIALTTTWNDGAARTLTVTAIKKKPLPPP